MAQWSPERPKLGERCRYTKSFTGCLRASFKHLHDRRGIVRVLDLKEGEALVRWEDSPGELHLVRLTNLVREDHEGPDPLDETVVHPTEQRIYVFDGD